MNATFERVSDACGIWSTRAEPPIHVAEGKVVNVQLSFTLSGLCFESQFTSSRMAHEPPHMVDGITFDAVECEPPQFVISVS